MMDELFACFLKMWLSQIIYLLVLADIGTQISKNAAKVWRKTLTDFQKAWKDIKQNHFKWLK